VIFAVDFDWVCDHEWNCAARASVEAGVLVHANVAEEVAAWRAIVRVLVFNLLPTERAGFIIGDKYGGWGVAGVDGGGDGVVVSIHVGIWFLISRCVNL
jgi:hypothetical protein